MKNSQTTSITTNNYSGLLLNIKSQIEKTQNNIINTITRQKLVMAWQIGKAIDEHLSKNTGSGYGKHLFEQLEQDVNINGKVLYKMRVFYQTYQTLPQDDAGLNWSHYRVLSGIAEEQARKYFENLTKEQGWSTNRLQEEVVKLKNSQTKKDAAKNDSKQKNTPKLTPKRGKLFSYPLIKLADASKSCIDLGFNIFKEAEEELPKATAIEVSRQQKGYLFAKSGSSSNKFNTYKAYLERVVDGDTLCLIIDLGFAVFHKEIIRLRGIDAPEISSAEGKKSCKILQKILKDVPFLIIKTSKIDLYGRYVADVFLANSKLAGKNSSQQVADEGVYLNQMLLDEGAASLF